ncbi:MAG: DUF2460 domain-containing protein [Xenococcus sp. (in: cyanobacteria)]
MVNFIDQELIFPVKPKETVTFSFDTTITEKPDRAERRLPVRTEYRAEIAFDTIPLERKIVDGSEVDELKVFQEFYKTVKGNYHSFLYKNSVDYQATAAFAIHSQEEGAIVTSQGVLYPISGSQFQLVKCYSVSATKGYKTLKFIDVPTLEIFIDGVQTFNFTVDGQTGRVEILDALSGEKSLTFNCEFYLEMRFSMEKFTARRISPDQYEVTGITLIEEISTAYKAYKLVDFQNIGSYLEMPYEPITDAATGLEIKIDALNNGREVRQTRYSDIVEYITYESNTITEKEKDFLLTWFITCKGRLLGFKVDPYYGRFDTDKLSFTNLPYDPSFGDRYYTVEDFDILGKENLVLPPGLPDFSLSSPAYLDFGLGFTEEPLDPPRIFTTTTSSSNENESRSGSSKASSGSSRGFGAASTRIPITIPTGFTPKVIGEIRGQPVILGTVNVTSIYNLFLAVPSLPYNGAFILHDLNYDAIGFPELFLYRNDALHTIVTVRRRGDSSLRVEICLEVFPDFSFQITELTKTTSNSGSLSKNFYSSSTTMSFSNDISSSTVMGNQPSSIAVEFNSYNGSSRITTELTKSLPPYEKNRSNPPGDRFIEGAIYFDRVLRKVFEIQNDEQVVIHDFSSTPYLLRDRMAGGMDAQGNLGFIVTDLRLCDDVIDEEDLTSCPNGSIVPQVAFFEKLAGETELRWVGTATGLDDLGSGINIHRTVYHKRTLIANNYIVHLPTGIFVPISQMGIGNPSFGLINAGQYYVVALVGSGSNWSLYYINFSF